MEALRDGPRTPSDIARRTSLQRSNVSRTISELLRHDIVYCVSPELRKGRLYGLAPESVMQLDFPEASLDFLPEASKADLVQGFAPQVRGEAMIAGVTATINLLGADAVVKLSRACGFSFFGIQREQWYSMENHHLLLYWLSELFEGGLNLCRQMGRRSIAHLPYLQNFIATRNLDVVALVERAPLVHNYYFNFGRFEVLPAKDGVEIRQFDMLATPPFCAARRGNYEGIMEARGYIVDVEERSCETRGDPYCTFRVRATGLRNAQQGD